MNVVSYDNFTFDDNSIISGKLNLANSLAFDSLVPDEMTIEVVSKDTGISKVMVQPETGTDLLWYTTTDNRGYVVMSNDIRQYVYGDPVLYRYDGALIGKFYLKSVTRLSEVTWRINMISAVGLWANRTHMGGVYSNVSAKGLIEDIVGADGKFEDYVVDASLTNVLVSGYLPIASARDNLQQVLFATGVGIVKDPNNGMLLFQFLDNQYNRSIASDDVFVGGSIDYDSPVTAVEVTEHEYYQSGSAQAETLFDNSSAATAADEALVAFGEPCFDLQWNGTAVSSLGWDNGANYCYVTGNGVLTGKKYTHISKPIKKDTGVDAVADNVKTVTDATLVSPLNVYTVADRLVDYYKSAERVHISIPLGEYLTPPSQAVKTGMKVHFSDPYDGETVTGMVETMDVTLSGKLKADCSIVKGYSPKRYENDFDSYVEGRAGYPNVPWETFRQNPHRYQFWWSGIPDWAKSIRIVVIGGGSGGQGGTNGSSATVDTWDRASVEIGKGGSGGVGGSGGKVAIFDIPRPTSATRVVVLGGMRGSGGVAGEAGTEGVMGGSGGSTKVWLCNGNFSSRYGEYTSTDGEVPTDGYRNPMSKLPYVYAMNGVSGIDGGDGGNTDQSGQSVTYNGTTWTGGDHGASVTDDDYYFYGGGGGGGAAYGANGNNGTDGRKGTGQNGWAGDGGAGADASNIPNPQYYRYGNGGNGGGGGGGGGVAGYLRQSYPSKQESGFYGGNGAGGAGAQGNSGQIGCAIFFFSSRDLFS